MPARANSTTSQHDTKVRLGPQYTYSMDMCQRRVCQYSTEMKDAVRERIGVKSTTMRFAGECGAIGVSFWP